VAEQARASAHFTTPDPSRLFEELARIAWHQDEPFASTSIFAQWCVFETAKRNGVTVMLDGQGADEALCGYRGFIGAYLASILKKGNLYNWMKEGRSIKREIGFPYYRSFGYTAAYLFPGLLSLIGRFDGREYHDQEWIERRHRHAFSSDPVQKLGGRPSSVRKMSAAQILATNLPRLLHWEDRNSMAFSVEARVPFLDFRVVELCLQMTDAEKMGAGILKSVLRKSMRGIVPDIVLDRRDKMGFLTAEPLWMTRDRSAVFRKELADAVDVLHGIVSHKLCDRFEQVVDGKRPFDGRYWRVISTARWAKGYSVLL
jgi:asparagine synthase (glutamine-hydrolysing)